MAYWVDVTRKDGDGKKDLSAPSIEKVFDTAAEADAYEYECRRRWGNRVVIESGQTIEPRPTTPAAGEK